jgi:hypothetical protein
MELKESVVGYVMCCVGCVVWAVFRGLCCAGCVVWAVV